MNIYKPYEMLADTPDTLHLKAGDARERMMFMWYRALPIALLLMVWYVLQQAAPHIPMGFNYLLVFGMAASVALLLFRSYITEIKIAAGNIFMVQQTIIGTKLLNIPIKDAGFITLHERKGSSGGVKFILHTKAKQRFTLLHIPPLWANEKQTLLIEETLRQLLRIDIIKNS